MLLEGKKILIMGIRNKWSIAYGIAKSAYENGAQLLFTYMGEENKEKIEELVSDFKGSKAYVLNGASEDELVKDVFIKIKEENEVKVEIANKEEEKKEITNIEEKKEYYTIEDLLNLYTVKGNNEIIGIEIWQDEFYDYTIELPEEENITGQDIRPMFFRAVLRDGVIEVPPLDSPEVVR